MADIERFGRTFSFDDGISDAQREQRIQKWMQQNAPDELTPASSPPAAAADKPKGGGSDALRALSSVLLGPVWGPASLAIPGLRDRAGDVNAYRTVAQGAIPFADEITAGARSLAGTPYDKALAEERQGVKDYADKYGEMESGALQVAGALGTIPLGMGAANTAAKVIPGGAKLAALIAKYPFLSSIATGATAGGVSSFGAGEGGLEKRLGDAAMGSGIGAVLGPAALGATKLVKGAGNLLNVDNKVGAYLAKRIAGEKNIDASSPTFIQDALSKLRTEAADQRRLRTKAVVGDLLPETMEAVLQKPGAGTAELNKALRDRQYNADLPEAVARKHGMFGRIGSTFDTAFGPDTFKLADADLIAQRKAHANGPQGFGPAYAQNIMSPEIADAMDRMKKLNPKILSLAETWAEAARPQRSVGTRASDGSIIDYNTQYLHDIKRSMEHVMGEDALGNPKFNDVPYISAKTALNDAIKAANPEYRNAMAKFGEDSELIDALKKGRNEIFGVPGSVDKTGAMDEKAIRNYMADPLRPQAQKDLFLIGGARGLREQVLGSQSKKYTHNWASFADNPDYERKIGALAEGHRLGSWDLLRAQLRKEDQNYMGAARARGNSRTNLRQELTKEMEGMSPNIVAALGLAINPKAPSGLRGVAQTILDKVDRNQAMANETAKILSGTGKMGTKKSLDDIERLLTEGRARDQLYKDFGKYAPGAAAFGLPYRED